MRAVSSIDKIASVASFFVSRIDGKIDAEIDRRVKEGDKDADALKALRGKVQSPMQKMAYQHYLEVIKSPLAGRSLPRRGPTTASAMGVDRHERQSLF